MKVQEVLEKYGWCNGGWGDTEGKGVCILHAVSIAMVGVEHAHSTAAMSGEDFILLREIAQIRPLDGIGTWNDNRATYEDVILVAKKFDEAKGW